VTLDWLLHANNPFEIGSSSFRNTGDKAGFYGQVVWSEAGKPDITQITDFPDVDPADYEGLHVSTRLKASFPASTRLNFMDDQGYDADLYFTDVDENTFKVVMKKLANS